MLVEFTSEAQLLAHYKAVRARMKALRAPKKPPVVVAVAPPPPPVPVKSRDTIHLLEILREAPRPTSFPGRELKIGRIQRLVCLRYGVPLIDLLSRRRTVKIARARQIGIWLCRHLTILSYNQIAHRFGLTDHSTVLAAVRRIDKLSAGDRAFALDIQQIKDEASSG